MYNASVMGTRHLGRYHTAVDHLRQEIAFFEGRLTELGELSRSPQADTLRRAYHALLRERRRQLASYARPRPD